MIQAHSALCGYVSSDEEPLPDFDTVMKKSNSLLQDGLIDLTSPSKQTPPSPRPDQLTENADFSLHLDESLVEVLLSEWIDCPICTERFHPDEITSHASICGEW